MIENVAIIAILVIILWGIVFGVYAKMTSEQTSLQDDLNALEALLENEADDIPNT